jgi:hypothetical protein
VASVTITEDKYNLCGQNSEFLNVRAVGKNGARAVGVVTRLRWIIAGPWGSALSPSALPKRWAHTG